MPRKKTTAIAKRTPPKKTALRPMRRKSQALVPTKPKAPELPAALARTLGEDVAIENFGLVELKFTDREEEILSEPVNLDDVRVKPTGQVYLPHIVYTRWLNRAFGRTGWALRPAAKPLIGQQAVVIPYLLMIHGQPVAFVYGEQEYFENNRDQSYGDALESTHASALRRCCKHLGMALDLWDKSFGEQYLHQNAIRVKVEKKQKGGEPKVSYQWRRRQDPPLYGEIRKDTRREEQDWTPPRTVAPAASHPDADQPITPEQVTRFWTIARRRGRDDAEIKRYLVSRYGIDSSKAIKRKDYETICQALEHPGGLLAREPGEEG